MENFYAKTNELDMKEEELFIAFNLKNVEFILMGTLKSIKYSV